MKKSIFLILTFIHLILVQQIALAESASQMSGFQMNRAAEYFLGNQDELLIKVNIWGRVMRPGQYNIPSGTDLVELLSAAGGPADKARLDQIRIIRDYQDVEKIIIVDLKKYLKTGNSLLIPELLPGDTIIVEGSIYYLLSSAVTVFSQLAIIANVYYLISRNK